MTFLSTLKAKVVGNVDDILASFHKTVNRLEVRADLHNEAAKAHAALVQVHANLVSAESEATARASSIAGKIKTLIS